MIQLIMDQDTGRSKGYGFITYSEAEDAKKALEQVHYNHAKFLLYKFAHLYKPLHLEVLLQSYYVTLCFYR